MVGPPRRSAAVQVEGVDALLTLRRAGSRCPTSWGGLRSPLGAGLGGDRCGEAGFSIAWVCGAVAVFLGGGWFSRDAFCFDPMGKAVK